MNARQKIERLTNSWYGYALFTAVLSVFSVRASGIFSLAIGLGMTLVMNAIALVISIAFITFFGRGLIGKSAGMRRFLVFMSGLFTLLGVLGTLAAGWDFLRDWSIAGLLSIVASAACTVMNARSYNVLTQTSVKAYFA
jgi:hypothetical protein